MHVSEDVDYHLKVIGAAADKLDSNEANKDLRYEYQYENDEEVVMGEKDDRGYHDSFNLRK